MKKEILIAVLCAASAAACSKPAEPVAIGDVCGKGHGTLVSAEGFLVLPNYMTAKTIYGKRENTKTYQLFLTSQPDAKGPSVRTIVTGTPGGAPNGITDLPPTGYSFRDLKIHTDDGATVGPGTRLKITGKVTPTGEGSCDLAVTTIETATNTAAK